MHYRTLVYLMVFGTHVAMGAPSEAICNAALLSTASKKVPLVVQKMTHQRIQDRGRFFA